MNAIWAIACKDLRLLLRDRMGFFFAFFFPLIVAIFFGTIFAGPESSDDKAGDGIRISILLVDEDQTDGSHAFARTLRAATELAVVDTASRDEAIGLVRSGKHSAFVILPKGFGAAKEGMFWSSGSSIGLGVDPSRRAESGMLEGVLTKYGFMQLQQGFEDPSKMRDQIRLSRDRMKSSNQVNPISRAVFDRFFNDLDTFFAALPATPEPSETSSESGAPLASADAPTPISNGAGWQPIRIDRISVTPPKPEGARPQSAFALTFPQGIIWGVMGCALGFSISLVTERTRGTLVRLLVAPVSPMQILMGKALACFLTTQAVSVFLLIIGVAVFGVRPTSWPLLILAVLATGVCFVGIMMLLAVLSPSERAGSGLGWGVLLLFSMIGGGMIPLFFMPPWMRSISVVSPIRWAVLALEGGIWRGLTLTEMLLPLAILTGIGIVGFAAGTRGMRLARQS